MAKSPKFDVFLSHNSRDTPSVRKFAEELEHRGLHPWLDEWEVKPGMPWQDAIQDALAGTKSIAVLIGKDGLGPWEALEQRSILAEAVGRGVRVIPVLMPGAPDNPKLPSFLQQYTWVDLRKGLTKDSLDRLQWGITGERSPMIIAESDDERIDLFLCFRSSDRPEVQQISEQLKRAHIRSWPNDWSLSLEESWHQLLSSHFQQIDALAVFAGDAGGPWVDDQVESFIWELIEAEQLVIPVILPNATRDPKFPVYLRRRASVDLRKSDSDSISLFATLLRSKERGSRNG